VHSDSLEWIQKGISTGLSERDFAIHPNKKWIAFSRGNMDQSQMGIVLYRDSIQQQLASFSGSFRDIEPFFHPKGDRLYFASNRPYPGRDSLTDYNIWSCTFDEKSGKLGEPIALPEVINTTANEFYPSITLNNDLFFTAEYKGITKKEDILVSRWENGRYQAPELLPSPINSEYYEFNAFVSADEHLIFFSAFGRPDEKGGGDLYLSFKYDDGTWSEPRLLPEPINSNRLDFCPFWDDSEKVLYFSSNRKKKSPKTYTLESLEHQFQQAGNGLGDLFRIKIDSL
jgi:hypothetical protein